MDIERALSVGELAKRSGVAVSALHYYEARGLIRSARSSGNQRRYARQVLRRIAVIKAAQRVGMPLGSIRDALKVPRAPGRGCSSGERLRILPSQPPGALPC